MKLFQICNWCFCEPLFPELSKKYARNPKIPLLNTCFLHSALQSPEFNCQMAGETAKDYQVLHHPFDISAKHQYLWQTYGSSEDETKRKIKDIKKAIKMYFPKPKERRSTIRKRSMIKKRKTLTKELVIAKEKERFLLRVRGIFTQYKNRNQKQMKTQTESGMTE